MMHCSENSIYVFPEKELRGLSPNFHIHVSVSDFMQTDRWNKYKYINPSQTNECRNWD
jgi:hypothetical protein